MRSRFNMFVLLAAPCLAQDAARMDQVIQTLRGQPPIHGDGARRARRRGHLSKGYGSANLEWDIPNTPATKFRLGSITKQFTAASILLLEERGKLKLDDPVKKYLPDAPAAWDKITIFNLLTHTSGIPNFTSLPDYKTLKPVATTSSRLIATVSRQAARFRARRKMELQQLRLSPARLRDREDYRRQLREVRHATTSSRRSA